MIQDIAPQVFHNQISWREPTDSDPVLAFTKDRKVYCCVDGNEIRYPTVSDLAARKEELQYLFAVDDTAYYLLEKEPEMPEKNGWTYQSTGKLRGMEASTGLFVCGAAESLYRWYGSQKFCGCCGEKMEKSKIERAMVCPACSNTVYPKICPAIIAAVCDGDRLVLTRYKNRPFKKYALVAGFAEIGESIEDTVRREVLEETGLHVGKLHFYKSQPWVFTDTLLMGFYCELEGSDDITVEEDELAEAAWFSREQVPEDFSHISLTGEMIERFRMGKEE